MIRSLVWWKSCDYNRQPKADHSPCTSGCQMIARGGFLGQSTPRHMTGSDVTGNRYAGVNFKSRSSRILLFAIYTSTHGEIRARLAFFVWKHSPCYCSDIWNRLRSQLLLCWEQHRYNPAANTGSFCNVTTMTDRLIWEHGHFHGRVFIPEQRSDIPLDVDN